MLLTTRTKVPRNSARNSFSIPCLIAQCFLILQLFQSFVAVLTVMEVSQRSTALTSEKWMSCQISTSAPEQPFSTQDWFARTLIDKFPSTVIDTRLLLWCMIAVAWTRHCRIFIYLFFGVWSFWRFININTISWEIFPINLNGTEYKWTYTMWANVFKQGVSTQNIFIQSSGS